MEKDPPSSRAPRLRGLDSGRLLGVLEGPADESTPEIPGWHITGVAGQGGSGIVWRAERLADGILAAIKTAAPDEPDTVERIEREAAFLHELRHPHIVELLETGPFSEGGIYLAMEFIDGPALVHEIPESGLPQEQAFRWFREIAAAVAHAHDAGILHRDLKPANVLIAPDGHLKVADFGLARPVHRRVHLLSLTRAGLVAGTAEYLPPEAYHGNYLPEPSADIFALGVMLHEMLTGTPPRGAWKPASSRAGVDVRVDDIIRRAMDPDPARRWPDARAMAAELDAVLASPPRYRGTPLVTFPVRVADCVWTLLGVFMFVAGTSSTLSLDKAWVRLPIDLVGNHGRLIGGFHALFILSMLAVPLGVWQIIRLRHFRHIPLREALPSPFGLRLGHGRTAAALVLLGQIFCLLAPVISMAILFRVSSINWLHPSDPPWSYGLAVTAFENHTPMSPWKLPVPGETYWLWESDGPPGHALAVPAERISFVPFFVPTAMSVGGLLAVAALLAATFAACRLWWRRRCFGRSLCIVIACSGMALVLASAHIYQARIAEAERQPSYNDWILDAHMTRHLNSFVEGLLGGRRELSVFGTDGGHLKLYAETVDYRDHGLVSRKSIPELYAAGRTAARNFKIKTHGIRPEWKPETGWFDLRVRALEFFDGLPDGGGSGVTLIHLDLAGFVTLTGHTAIHREKLSRQPLWLADERAAEPHEAAAWAGALQHAAAAAARDPQSAAVILDPLFHPVSVEPDEFQPPGHWYLPGTDHAGSVIRLLMDGALTFQTDAASVAETLPGGRSVIVIPVRQAINRTLRAELIHCSGTWHCVKLAF